MGKLQLKLKPVPAETPPSTKSVGNLLKTGVMMFRTMIRVCTMLALVSGTHALAKDDCPTDHVPVTILYKYEAAQNVPYTYYAVTDSDPPHWTFPLVEVRFSDDPAGGYVATGSGIVRVGPLPYWSPQLSNQSVSVTLNAEFDYGNDELIAAPLEFEVNHTTSQFVEFPFSFTTLPQTKRNVERAIMSVRAHAETWDYANPCPDEMGPAPGEGNSTAYVYPILDNE